MQHHRFLSWLLVSAPVLALVSVAQTLTPSLDTKVLLYRTIAAFGTAVVAILLFMRKGSIATHAHVLWKKPIGKLMIASAFMLVISTACAFDRYIAFFGTSARGEGFLTLFSLLIIYALFVLFFKKEEWNRFFIASAATGIALAGIEIIQRLSGVERPDATMGNPISLSAIYLFTLFAGYYLCIMTRTRGSTERSLAPVLGTSAMIASLLGILLTQTRGTFVGVFVAALITLILGIIHGARIRVVRRVSLRKVSIGIGSVLLAFGVLFGATRSAAFWQSVPGLNRLAQSTTENTSSRLIYAKISVKGFAHSTPVQQIFGWGWDNYKIVWDANYDPAVYFYDPATPDRAHNKLLDMLIMTGVLGLLVYLALWYYYFRASTRILRTHAMLALGIVFVGVGYFVHNLFAFDTPTSLLGWYALLAFLTTYDYDA